MNVGQICTRNVITVRGDDTVARAATKLRRFHVGDVVVLDAEHAKPTPIGVLTDRDILVGVVAEAAEELQTLRTDEVVRGPLRLVEEDTDLFDAVDQMIEGGVRRLPVVDDIGALVGILTLDDVVGLLSRTLADLADIPGAQREEEWEERP